jgi:hypothetical protein
MSCHSEGASKGLASQKQVQGQKQKFKIKTNRRQKRAGIHRLWKTPMTTHSERRPIALHQLSAIARSILEADPAIEESEWKAAIRDKATRQGYDTAPPELLWRAMERAADARKREKGPRPVVMPQPPERRPHRQHDPPWRGRPPTGWAIVARLLAERDGPASPDSSKG